MVAVALFALYPAVGRGAIQYTNFGGAPVTLSPGYQTANVSISGLGTVIFELGVTTIGELITDTFGRVRFSGGTTPRTAILTDENGDIEVLTEDESISSTSEWSSLALNKNLYEWNNEEGFTEGLLSPSVLGTIGLQFRVNGLFYYGWVNVINIDGTDGSTFTIQAFAFNDEPGAPILAGQTEDPPPPPPPPASTIPEPASLGMILLGAAGIYALRRRDD